MSRLLDAGFADLAKRPVYRGGGEGYIEMGCRLMIVRSGALEVIQPERARNLNNKPIRDGRYVLYWMQ